MSPLHYLYVFLVSACYAIQFFISKLAVEHVDYINLIIQRYIVGSIILFILTMIFRRNEFIESVSKETVMYSFFIALCSVMGSAFLYLLLKSDSLSIVIPTIEPLIVVLTFIFGLVFLKEKFSFRLLGGIVLAIVGVYLINTSKH